MNGEIGVDSEEGKGTTFWFNLAFGNAGNDLISGKNDDKKEKLDKSSLNILLAEDNPINQRVALFNLKKMGHQVDIAENGKIAVEFFSKNKYDIILMDIQMPEMDGLEATKQIRNWEKKNQNKRIMPIIAMTANAMRGDKENFINQGMSGYISKPFKIKELETILKMA